jgi:hypothetical protein
MDLAFEGNFMPPFYLRHLSMVIFLGEIFLEKNLEICIFGVKQITLGTPIYAHIVHIPLHPTFY